MSSKEQPEIEKKTPARPGLPRRLAEVLTLTGAAAFVMWFATTLEMAGPLVGLCYALFLAPAVVRRWNLPLFGFMVGFLGWFYYAHQPLMKWGMVAFWVLPLALTLHYITQPLMTWLLDRATGWPAVVVLPLTVGAAEWLRPIIGVGNYNMYQVGTFLYDWPTLIQFADVVGALGLSVLWMIPWATLVDLMRWRLDGASLRPVKLGAIASALVFALLVGYGTMRLGGGDRAPGPTIAVIQPSLDHSHPEQSQQIVIQSVRLTDAMVPENRVDMIVWPENAVLLAYLRHQDAQDAVTWLTARKNAPLLFGTQAYTPDGKRPTNTAFLVGADGEITGRYDKIVMFPFTERRMFEFLRTPAPAVYEFFVKLTESSWGSAPDGKPGEKVELLALDVGEQRLHMFVPICYESGYPGLAREAARRGADFFVNLSSEGWLGFASAHNMMGVNVMRSVENRIPLVRAGNTGISGFITSDGVVQKYLRGRKTGRRLLEDGAAVAQIEIDSRSVTFYSSAGDWLDPAWILAWLFAVLGLPLVRRLRR